MMFIMSIIFGVFVFFVSLSYAIKEVLDNDFNADKHKKEFNVEKFLNSIFKSKEKNDYDRRYNYSVFQKIEQNNSSNDDIDNYFGNVIDEEDVDIDENNDINQNNEDIVIHSTEQMMSPQIDVEDMYTIDEWENIAVKETISVQKVKTAKKQRTALQKAYIMSEIFNKPKGLQ